MNLLSKVVNKPIFCGGTFKEAIGDEVTEVKVGDRVAFNVEGANTYAEKAVVNSDRLAPNSQNLRRALVGIAYMTLTV
ncbi:hypothetical protein SAMD00079811_35420 [Scytonema sp. HK-05]|uniref:hypothetical protein n=1 Tax=Scytonema sp. HK-05 TaxID=1137095 RepID=UPI00093671BF|nr:hypothetical protein [Scytonema sp. HK-05]OKH60546.1 hypothetical protein NIES2130_02180 [Scytonema sp. HK-05]BAY45935.1 hypothetical protein SAMD00079811_35420 [Scytonema sp. HK-05]